MKDFKRGRLIGLCSLMVAAACSDAAAPTGPGTAARADRKAGEAMGSSTAERAALAAIGKAVAISLGERNARYQLKNDLRAAPFREHKVELSRYLRSERGRGLLAARGAGKPPDDVLTLLDQVRPLEFYMPVRSQRETWVGDDEVLVAVQLEEEDPIVAFNARGVEIQLDSAAPPSQPVLSIVPVETSFDRPLAANSRNVGDRGGQSIGTLMAGGFRASNYIAIEDGGGSGGGGGGYTPPGMYLEFSRILDLHESWNRGDPEIEVHVQGPRDPANPRTGEDLSCSGEHAYDYRKVFDQDGGFWEGRVMLFSDNEISTFNSKFQDGFHVLFWEDDDTPCVLKLDNQTLIELIKSTSLATGSVALKVIPFGWKLAATLFLATLFTNPGEWLLTNDDFVGAAVATENSGYYYPNNTHVIMKGTALNGRATIIKR